MTEINGLEDLDELIWSHIEGSLCADDYLLFVEHTDGRKAKQGLAIQKARELFYQHQGKSKWGQAIASVRALAQSDNTAALRTLGRWHKFGWGFGHNANADSYDPQGVVRQDEAQAKSLYLRGAELGNTKCMIALARSIEDENPEEACRQYQRIVELGDLTAHVFWADLDKGGHVYHLREAAKSGDPYCLYALGYELERLMPKGIDAKNLSEKEVSSRVEEFTQLLKRATQGGVGNAALLLSTKYLFGDVGFDKDPETARDWFRIGASLGHGGCLYYLGTNLISDASSTSQQRAEGVEHLLVGSFLNDSLCQLSLGTHWTLQGDSFDCKKRGFDWLVKSVEQGVRAAMYRLGCAYRNGSGVEKNGLEAIKCFERGAAAGNVQCQTSLGMAYYYGEDIPKDYKQAFKWFQVASLQNDPYAHQHLGHMYELGHGVEKDERQAVEYFTMASKEKLPQAFSNLGWCYMVGAGVEADQGMGISLFKEGATLGNTNCMSSLGMMLLNGEGFVHPNPKLAVHWFEKAIQKEDSTAMRCLAEMLLEGNGIDQDSARGRHLMGKAAALGDEKAQSWVKENLPKSPEWLVNLASDLSKEQLIEENDDEGKND